jgi:alkylation response protein AidB-like acyl-CoA dehydrogenase
MAINSMALPPIIKGGSKALKDKIVRDVVTGKKHVCLAISEPWAGSDVSAIRTSAVKTADGKAYIVNGEKKWITGGMMADYFTTAVRTGGEDSGATGVSLLVIDRNLPGITVRKMETQVCLCSRVSVWLCSLPCGHACPFLRSVCGWPCCSIATGAVTSCSLCFPAPAV